MFGYNDETQNFIVREALRLEYTPIEALRLRLDFTLSRSDGKWRFLNRTTYGFRGYH